VSDWKPYFGNRLIRDAGNYSVIVPVDATEPMPMACALCDNLFRDRDDQVAYDEFGCCDRCARLWAHMRREAWKAGWRPTPEQVANAEQDRLPLAVSLDVK
jgi:hypothetical protein